MGIGVLARTGRTAAPKAVHDGVSGTNVAYSHTYTDLRLTPTVGLDPAGTRL